ncbi:hypothetical protein [Chitinophaga nivalis]|uniref:Uncharacterized protein n=1 Tax=Chitinophaga nivalis TaxID=2991709 RepID=A0ABT3IEI5_9BACT|nr:hypothetical protein [Chitinophaga nivalis]MCW3467940.1 hypothetical protein [Chitinophaga nivalis]MCW3482369.1 hypothetical protein [Chitinophaga nivalis]
MLKEIINKYEDFADALVLAMSFEIDVHSADSKGKVEIMIHCMNRERDYEWEKVKLIFEEVLSFRFIENRNTCSVVINTAMIRYEDNEIVFDFFPIILDADLKENTESDLIVKCRTIKYIVDPLSL